MDMLKDACTTELRKLLLDWQELQDTRPAASPELIRLGERIKKLCDYLDGLDRA